MSIQEHLNKIRNAIKGSEVRESIAKGIERAYDDASEYGNANMEVKIARGTHPTLRNRLNEVDNTQQQTTAQLAQTQNELDFKRDKSEKIKSSDLDTSSDANKVQLINLSEGVQQAMAGTAPVISSVADRSLTTEKHAIGSITPAELKMNIGYFAPARVFRINVDTINAKVIVESEVRIHNGINSYIIPVQSVDFPTTDSDIHAHKYVFCDKDNGQIVIKPSNTGEFGLVNESRNLVFLFMVNAGRVSGPAWQVKINGVENTADEPPEKVRFAFLGSDLNINTSTKEITLGNGRHFSELGSYRSTDLEPITYSTTTALLVGIDTDENKLVIYGYQSYPANKNIMLLAVWNEGADRLYTMTPERVYIDGVQLLSSLINTPIVPSRGSKWSGKIINFIGDSITAPADSYASVVGTITGATIRNYGISNSTIADYNDPISERYVDMDDNADLVLVLASRNDYRHNRSIGTPEDTDNSTFYGAVKQLFNGLSEKYPLKTVGIILPFKARANQGDDGEIKDNTWINAHGHVQEDYNNVLKEIAKEYAFPTFDLYNEGNFTSWNQTQRNTWFRDTIHPNSEGHEYLGQKVASWIETI